MNGYRYEQELRKRIDARIEEIAGNIVNGVPAETYPLQVAVVAELRRWRDDLSDIAKCVTEG